MNFSTQTRLSNDSRLNAKGRFGRLAFAAWVLISNLILLALFFITTSLNSFFNLNNIVTNISFIIFIVFPFLLYTYYNFVFIIRRLHDLNKTGWISVISIIPGVHLFFLIYLLSAKGNTHLNDFGPAPQTSKFEKFLGIFYIIAMLCVLVFSIITIFSYTYSNTSIIQVQNFNVLK